MRKREVLLAWLASGVKGLLLPSTTQAHRSLACGLATLIRILGVSLDAGFDHIDITPLTENHRVHCVIAAFVIAMPPAVNSGKPNARLKRFVVSDPAGAIFLADKLYAPGSRLEDRKLRITFTPASEVYRQVASGPPRYVGGFVMTSRNLAAGRTSQLLINDGPHGPVINELDARGAKSPACSIRLEFSSSNKLCSVSRRHDCCLEAVPARPSGIALAVER